MSSIQLPISTEELCLYVPFLIQSLKSLQSIHTYVLVLKTLHQILDLGFLSYASIRVKLTFKAFDRLLCCVPHQAAPMMPQILRRIYDVLQTNDPCHVAFWCILVALARRGRTATIVLGLVCLSVYLYVHRSVCPSHIFWHR